VKRVTSRNVYDRLFSAEWFKMEKMRYRQNVFGNVRMFSVFLVELPQALSVP